MNADKSKVIVLGGEKGLMCEVSEDVKLLNYATEISTWDMC